jgi:hypothetical protein
MGHPSLKHELFLCDCVTPQHHFIVTYDIDDDDIYVQVKLNPNRSLWERLKQAFRHVFRLGRDDFQYEEVLLTHPDRQKLAKMLLSKPKKETKNVRANAPKQ